MLLQALALQVRLTDYISNNEDDVFRIVLDQNNAVGDARVLPDRVFNLAQFYP